MKPKQIIIVAVYLIIFFAIIFGVYRAFLKPESTCSDGKQNQGEQGIDCGGPCSACEEVIEAKDLEVTEEAFMPGGLGRYDVMARVKNPNAKYGSSFFRYEFVLKDSSGNVLAEKTGRSFVLPSEEKFVIEENLETEIVPDSVSFIVSEITWEKFSNYKEEPQLVIFNKRYNLVSSGTNFSEVYGILRNDSPFDFTIVEINIVLRDSRGNPLSARKTQMNTVIANERRDFNLGWTYSFPVDVEAVEIEAESNVYDVDNFIKQYLLPGGEFQSF